MTYKRHKLGFCNKGKVPNPKTRAVRSDKYQALIKETCFSDELLGTFKHTDAYGGEQSNQRLLELQDDLIKLIWQTAEEHCTEMQLIVLKRYFKDGWTQKEIAEEIGSNQSCIVKSLQGNTMYHNGKKTLCGGSLRKLYNILMKDEEVLSILKKIEEIDA